MSSMFFCHPARPHWGDMGDHGDEVGWAHSDQGRVNPRDFFDGTCAWVREGPWICCPLPACWGGGVARCRRTTSAHPPELGSASQTASPAPALRPAGRPYSHTAPFTRWEQSTGQDRVINTREPDEPSPSFHPKRIHAARVKTPSRYRYKAGP